LSGESGRACDTNGSGGYDCKWRRRLTHTAGYQLRIGRDHFGAGRAKFPRLALAAHLEGPGQRPRYSCVVSTSDQYPAHKI
jgi:hypothetical protein